MILFLILGYRKLTCWMKSQLRTVQSASDADLGPHGVLQWTRVVCFTCAMTLVQGTESIIIERSSDCDLANIANTTVVVIDVLRAFTTAAFAFAAGAEKIVIVSDVEQAFEARAHFPHALLIGEADGQPISGFDCGNSPMEMTQQDLKNKTLIQCTSAGTRGVACYKGAAKILVCGFTNAEATLQRIQQLKPTILKFIITGLRDGSEDRALADYLVAKMTSDGVVNPEPYLQKVKTSPEGLELSRSTSRCRPKEDLALACMVDHFSFAMELFCDGKWDIVYPVFQEHL